jgi:hypothetical protein
MKKLNLTNQKFGKLTVVEEVKQRGKATRWLCRCECGNTTVSLTNNLRRGISKSCGCVRNNKTIARNHSNRKHGMKNSGVYRLWKKVQEHPHGTTWENTINGGKEFKEWCVSNGWKPNTHYFLKIKRKSKASPETCSLIVKTPDLTGHKIGRLLVLNQSTTDKKLNAIVWDCLCECGTFTKSTTRQLTTGSKLSCGCYKSDMIIKRNKENATHGLRNHHLYRIWRGMLNRCSGPNKYYYDKGIKVCHEWKKSVVPFVTWMLSNGWKPGLSLHRIDPDGDYSPTNCTLMTKGDHSRLHNKLRADKKRDPQKGVSQKFMILETT